MADANFPKMSFLMITYNQEAYIADALHAALQQDYPNLDIVVCDDVSQDKTFDIARKIADEYRGPHKLVLHRNEKNLGIAPNFHKAATLAEGEWLLMAAGDDISMPSRCKTIAKAIQNFPNALAFTSFFEIIDENNTTLGYPKPDFQACLGAPICWHRTVFDLFPPMTREIGVEDQTLALRLFLLGASIVKLKDVLIKYRIDGHHFTGIPGDNVRSSQEFRLRMLKHLNACFQKAMDDIQFFKQHFPKFTLNQHVINRQQWNLNTVQNDMLATEITLRILQGNLINKIHYICTPSEIVFHKSLKNRFFILLCSFNWLISLKRFFLGARKKHLNLIPENRENELKNCSTTEVTFLDYLTNPIYVPFQQLDPSSFTRDYLTPQQKQVLVESSHASPENIRQKCIELLEQIKR